MLKLPVAVFQHGCRNEGHQLHAQVRLQAPYLRLAFSVPPPTAGASTAGAPRQEWDEMEDFLDGRYISDSEAAPSSH
jgi:hypothetical protein